MIHKLAGMRKHRFFTGLFDQPIRLRVDSRRRVPVVEFKTCARSKIDAKLATLRPQPEAFLPTKHINVLFQLAAALFIRQQAALDDLVVQPPKARSNVTGGCAGHHATLKLWHNRHLALAASQDDHIRMLLQKGNVGAEICHGAVTAGSAASIPPRCSPSSP